jgi:2-haloacid dehalogenase
MFDMLGCGPEDVLHCSSSFRYDLMSAYDLGIKHKVWVNRGHEPANPYYEYTEIRDISGLPGVVGL